MTKRSRTETRFKFYGVISIVVSCLMLTLLLASIISKGVPAFKQTKVTIPLFLDHKLVAQKRYSQILKNSLYQKFPLVKQRRDKKKLFQLLSYDSKYELQDLVSKNPDKIGSLINFIATANPNFDQYIKGHIKAGGKISNKQKKWIDRLVAEGKVKQVFNWQFFSNSDSRKPEIAGIKGALIGSLMTISITFVLSFMLGVMTAIYLEEFTKQNKFAQFIEVNINNLASVPSIVFGLLGLMVFLIIFELPRSSPLVGGLVLTLMTLPTIVIAARAALKSVPPSLSEAALGIGASHMQAVFQHKLPYAMPGILTGSIIGIAQALGETAPLLMIGMVAFIVDVPESLTDAATVLPVQIFIWADSPERAFAEKTAAAIMVLLGFLIMLNLLAVYLRRKLERKW